MTDPSENLAYAKQTTGERLIAYLNGLTTNALAQYPQAEVESWSIQRAEADAFLAAGESATLDLAPFLTRVCEVQFGPADDATRLAQVTTKAGIVQANGIAWSGIAAFVNGLRARTQEQIAAATTADDCLAIIQAAMAEADAFRATAGI